MQELNLDVAGEFLVMAATLIHIKSRMLLPRPDPAQEDPEEDPREALVRRLLEHQKFKAAAELLHERETLRSAQWTRARRPDRRDRRRGARAGDRSRSLQPDQRLPRRRRARASSGRRCTCRGEQIPIEDRIEQLLARLSETEACGFEDLFADMQSRAGMIVTFLALLEMIRLKLIRVFQSGAIGPIRVYKRARPADAPSFDRAQEGPEPVEGPSLARPRRTLMEHLKPIVEALIFASPEPVTPKTLYKLLDGEPKEDVDAALAAVRGDYERAAAACRSSKSPAATRSSRGPSCTNGCASCSTSGPRRSCRCSRSRRWRSSPTSSRSPRRRSPRSAASAAAAACCRR